MPRTAGPGTASAAAGSRPEFPPAVSEESRREEEAARAPGGESHLQQRGPGEPHREVSERRRPRPHAHLAGAQRRAAAVSMLRVPARVEGVAWRTPPIQRLPALEADPNNMTSVQSPLCLAQYKTLGEAVKDQIPPGGRDQVRAVHLRVLRRSPKPGGVPDRGGPAGDGPPGELQVRSGASTSRRGLPQAPLQVLMRSSSPSSASSSSSTPARRRTDAPREAEAPGWGGGARGSGLGARGWRGNVPPPPTAPARPAPGPRSCSAPPGAAPAPPAGVF